MCGYVEFTPLSDVTCLPVGAEQSDVCSLTAPLSGQLDAVGAGTKVSPPTTLMTRGNVYVAELEDRSFFVFTGRTSSDLYRYRFELWNPMEGELRTGTPQRMFTVNIGLELRDATRNLL